MAQCKARLKSGLRCRSQAGEDEFCPKHRTRKIRRNPFQKRVNPDELRVPRKYYGVYQSFLNSEEPYNLKAELAIQRTLFVEARDHLEQRSEERQENFLEYVESQLKEKVKGDPGRLQALVQRIRSILQEGLEKFYPSLCGSMEDFKTLSSLLDQTARTAERMKKIQEGVKMEIRLDKEMLISWLKFVVFPFVTDPAIRGAMVQRAATFKLPKPSDHEDHEDHDHEEDEFEVPVDDGETVTVVSPRHPAMNSLSLRVEEEEV
jgi:hypothetical protein